MPNDATCKTCPLWQKAGEEYGYCHHISVVHAEDNGVGSDFWCSEHPLRQRDRLVAMAMQAVESSNLDNEVSLTSVEVAERAYLIADEMIKRRSVELSS
jgi:hypothetical protein